ncbi:15942_t:CDS:1 [Funneliformis geosporum]|uniref:18975_t:CDS:1 n=1 Tax=Funneliformis geosporum TaxID=1117311 RepID=A0A9W4WUP2_9GLOM|nr:18975_t:CDS:1 [Funneliformis geosporum]CAI2169817.1 15942_t:CDS:1 [Funneliformis geosporum]
MNSPIKQIKFIGPYELILPKTTEKFHLSAIRTSDIPQIVSLLESTNINSIDIHKSTISLPNPYTLSDAKWFVNKSIAEYRTTSRCNIWAIRKSSNDEYIGCIGLHSFKDINFLEDERDKKLFNEGYGLGYYISLKYRNLGIVSSAVNFICDEIAFKELRLDNVYANVFTDNVKSQNLLKKCDFKLIKLIPKALEKSGEMRDMYSFIKKRK